MEFLWASIRWLFRNIENLRSILRRTADAVRIWVYPTSSVFYVNGRFLYDNNREKVILRGINLMLLDDWRFPRTNNLEVMLGELAGTGANAVRIQWYTKYPQPKLPNPQRDLYNLSDLDAFLNRCRINRLIPIVELHDWTCRDFRGTDDNGQMIDRLMLLINWWTNPDVVALLRRHERYLIINLANELGWYRWQGSSATVLNAFRDAYKTAITAIRNQGLRMPIMIDAPDCGQSINAFTSIGRELIDHDPQHSLLLSVHAYWAGYDGTREIDRAVQANLPIVFGEIANKQDISDRVGNIACFYALDGTDPGIRANGTTVFIGLNNAPEVEAGVGTAPFNEALVLAMRERLGTNNTPPTSFRYQNLLRTLQLQQNQIGWLAWAWHLDSCPARRMTSNGNFNSLTVYGNDIVNNRDYGLSPAFSANPAIKTNSLPGAPPLFPGQPFPSNF